MLFKLGRCCFHESMTVRDYLQWRYKLLTLDVAKQQNSCQPFPPQNAGQCVSPNPREGREGAAISPVSTGVRARGSIGGSLKSIFVRDAPLISRDIAWGKLPRGQRLKPGATQSGIENAGLSGKERQTCPIIKNLPRQLSGYESV